MSFWTDQAVIYQIFIDRFAGFDEDALEYKPDFIGGNFKGITEKVDYLTDLGINVVWLSPFFKNAWYHGYEPIDFTEPDPHFGTKEDLRKLTDRLHARGIRVLMDFVPNHCSYKDPMFQDAQKHQNSQYRNWFYFRNWPNDYICYFDFKKMPKMNLDYRPARDYMIGAAEMWMRECGIDGFRLDHAPGPSNDFWKEFNVRTKAINPESVMIGEVQVAGLGKEFHHTIMMDSVHQAVIEGREPDLSSNTKLIQEYIGIFDGALDFNFYGAMLGFAHGQSKLEDIRRSMNDLYAQFPNDFLLPNFLDCHDKNRYLFENGQNYENLLEASAFQFTLPQPPIIYYGTEVGMTHFEPIVENSPEPGKDLGTRKKMNWKPNTKQKQLLASYADLIKQRTKDVF